VDGEDSRSSGLVQVSNGLYAQVLLWCANGPIVRRWIVPTCVWKLPDCKDVSLCPKNVQGGRVRVFEEFLTVINCCVLSFRNAIKFHREQNPGTLQYSCMKNKLLRYLNTRLGRRPT
jgi:hypothetical protein